MSEPEVPEEGQKIDEIMEDALPDELDDESIDEEEPREPGVDAF